MTLYENPLYIEDIEAVSSLHLPWEELDGAAFLISGAGGLLGSFFTDVLLERNIQGANIKILALGRSLEKLEKRFGAKEGLYFVKYDINDPINLPEDERKILKDAGSVYIIHLASNTHPLQYSTDPIGTVMTNITGLDNMLKAACEYDAKRIVFASSNEIYGENRKDTELFSEDYCGYIDCNTLRAGYPESKRAGEALCQAYRKAKGLDIVIPRFTRSYGPTLLMTDTKAISQFIKKGIAGEDIVLKSRGDQFYSYTYVADAISGLFTVLLSGKDGEAYNIADEASDITLRDLAMLIAQNAGTKVVFDIPDETEAAGYSKATKARLDGSKLKELGWRPRYDIHEGIKRTMDIFAQLSE